MADTRYINNALNSASNASRGLDKAIKRRKSLQDRLKLAGETSALLSSVWSKHPTTRLRFGTGVDDLSDVKGGSTPGFHATSEEGERFIALSSTEIARYQSLLYANGASGGHRRLLIVLQGMDASGKGGIVRHVFRQVNPHGNPLSRVRQTDRGGGLPRLSMACPTRAAGRWLDLHIRPFSLRGRGDAPRVSHHGRERMAVPV